jgi:hypothetical protein
VVQPDGKIVATGLANYTALAVARLTPGGQPDPTFSGDGRTTVPLSVPFMDEVYPGVTGIDREGRIVVVGSGHSLSRNTSAPLLVRLQGGGAPVLPGDINADGSVNGSDFSILAGNFGKAGMTYDKGDLNGDGRVDGADFAILAANFGKTAGA